MNQSINYLRAKPHFIHNALGKNRQPTFFRTA